MVYHLRRSVIIHKHANMINDIEFPYIRVYDIIHLTLFIENLIEIFNKKKGNYFVATRPDIKF